MTEKFRNGFRLAHYMVMAVSCCIWSFAAPASESLPAFGSDAQDTVQYDAAVRDAGRPLRWNLRFMSDSDVNFSTAPLDDLAAPARNVRYIVITLEIQASLADIRNGRRDRNLGSISGRMHGWQKTHPDITLVLRPFHEMNGDWYPWGFGKTHNGNSAEQFTGAWNHVRAVMHGEFPGLAFMWCPNVLMGRQDNFAAYYPGNSQVEYIGLDGYNHSSSQGGWVTMQNLFHDSLVAVRALPGGGSKPLVIAETATTEPDEASARKGHSKAEWFGNAHGDMGWWLHNEAVHFGVGAVLYFNHKKTGVMGDKSSLVNYLVYDPSLPTAEASREAFRESVHDLP